MSKVLYIGIDLSKKTLDVAITVEGKEINLEDVGGSSYLTYLTGVVPSTVNAGYYAKLVKETARERMLLLT
jgi:replicative DNA helicase